MKNIYLFQPCIFMLALFCVFFNTQPLQAQTTLAAGDLAFTLMNMEGSDTDAFGFVLLKAVEAGTVIRVTDKEYTTGVGFEANEGILTFTFTSAFPCGTQVIVTDMDPASPVYDFQANLAGVTTVTSPANSFQLSTSGDGLTAFQSDNLTNPPAGSFISALANTGVDFGVVASGSGDLPPGLTIGNSAMAMTADPNGAEWDNIKYDCSTTANADLDALRMAIYTPANWLTDNDTPLPTTGCDPAFSCMDACTDPTVTFMPSSTSYCVDAGVQMGLGGGTPTGGTYSGPGVTDDGNGMTFNFDPAAAGVGMQVLRYDYTAPDGCSNSADATVEVQEAPAVTFNILDSVSVNSIVLSLSGGSPAGGVYSGPGVTDDGNGFTFNFDPGAAGLGVHPITYTFTGANGCTASASDDIKVFLLPISAIDDIDEVDANGVSVQEDDLVAVQGVVHCIDFSPGAPLEFWIMEAGGSGISVFAANAVNDYMVTEGDELYIEGMLSTFNGLLDLLPTYIEVKSQGNTLNTPIEVMELDEDNESKYVTLMGATILDGASIMSESGGVSFSVVTAAIDTLDVFINDATGIDTMFLNQFLEDGAAMGNAFTITGIVSQDDGSIPYDDNYELWVCGQDDFNIVVSVNEPTWAAELQLYPNPTSDILHLNAPVEIETYRLIDLQGRILQSGVINNTQHNLSIQHLPKGVYQLQLISGGDLVTRRVIKQ